MGAEPYDPATLQRDSIDPRAAPPPHRALRAANAGVSLNFSYFHFPRNFREKGYLSALSALPGGVPLRIFVNRHRSVIRACDSSLLLNALYLVVCLPVVQFPGRCLL